MAKILECAKVDPSSGCQHILRGDMEVIRKVAEHAKEHSILEGTPKLMDLVKANMALLFLSRFLLWIDASEEEETSKSNLKELCFHLPRQRTRKMTKEKPARKAGFTGPHSGGDEQCKFGITRARKRGEMRRLR